MQVVLLDLSSLDLAAQRDLELGGRSVAVRDEAAAGSHLHLEQNLVDDSLFLGKAAYSKLA